MTGHEGGSLVLPPAWIGDAVLALPSIRSLAALGPVAILAHPRVAPLFDLAGGFARVERFAGPAASIAGLRQARSLGLRGNARAVVLPRSLSSAIRARASGVRERIGIDDEGRRLLLTKPVRIPWPARTRHIVEEFALVAEAAGAERPQAVPRVALSEACAERGRALLAAAGVDRARPLVTLAPGAAFGPAKRWAPHRYALVAQRAAAAGCVVLLVGGDADRAVTAAVARAAADPRGVVDLAGKTDLAALAAILAASRVSLVNDSGPMHLAAAVGTPVVALFGSTNPAWTAPIGDGHAVLRYPVPCSPCYRRTCPIGAVCFAGISVDAAWAEVARRIA